MKKILLVACLLSGNVFATGQLLDDELSTSDKEELGKLNANQVFELALDARNEYASEIFISEELEQEIRCLLKFAADKGHAQAQEEYATACLFGIYGGKNNAMAAHYYKLAAAQGNEKAKEMYEALQKKGIG
jgi:TPR repeat protein